MRIPKCPNCGGSEFYKREVDSAGGYGPTLLPGAGAFMKSAKFEINVCGNCGFVRWFVARRFLERLKSGGKWERV
ncbi:MAG TPA: hypothetical protein VLA34_04830 [Candidatus Krumholzibacterium sp.]|nr:hypothetical protein [Candidatus Krumholzibacterium sp.]